MSYKQFANDLKKDVTGSYIFMYGAEDFLMSWAIDLVKEKYVSEEYRDFDIIDLDGEACAAGDIVAAARSYSMFSDRRVVIVRNFMPLYHKGTKAEAASDEKLIELCREVNDSTVVVYVLESKHEKEMTAFGKKLMKACNSYDFARLDKAELAGFINKRLHSAGLLIGRNELQYLIDLSGYYYKDSDYSLYDMNRDLLKITNACEGDTVGKDLIEELLIGADDKFVFNLIDAITSGNNSKAMEMTTAILQEDDNAMMLLSLITKQFELMYDALELADEGYTISVMAKEIGVNEFRFKKAYQAARRFNRSRIRNILIHLYNLDRDIKMGDIDRDVAMELFVATV